MTELSPVLRCLPRRQHRNGISAVAVVFALVSAACGGSKSATSGAGGNGGVSSGSAGDNGTAGIDGSGNGGNAGTKGGVGGSPGIGGKGVGGHIGVGGAIATCMAPIAITTGAAATVTANLGMRGQTVGGDFMGIHTSVYDSNMNLDSTAWLLQDAGVKSLRYPGGSYSDLYHWESNTGTSTPASGGGSNTIYIASKTDFGSFIGFMERVGANAMITVNYGVNSAGTGPAVPQEGAAWVAYANGSTTNTTVIGIDADNHDWKTVGYWAALRSSAPLATDDGMNFLRINHPAPVGIKNWEIGNEIYGNGYYFGKCGWEADMHFPYPNPEVTNCVVTDANGAAVLAQNRAGKAPLSPATYGAGVKAFSIAMKAVDPSIKIGGIVAWPTASYSNPTLWNTAVLTPACANMDFAVVHWYAGKSLDGALAALPNVEIPAMFSTAAVAGTFGPGLRNILATTAFHCAANMPIAVTEWGPNTLAGNVLLPLSTPDAAPVGSQVLGLFAAESYANFMEQGALSVHWLELHNNTYLAGVDATADPFTNENDTPRWGYHGQQMAYYLAKPGDTMVTTTVTGAGATPLRAHSSAHADGGVSVMITNTSATDAANVTVAITGGATTLACVGVAYSYTPINANQDGTVVAASIFSTTDGLSVPVAVPAYSTVVVSFPKK